MTESMLYFRFKVSLSICGPEGDATMTTFADLNVDSVEEAEVLAKVMLRSSRTGFHPLYVGDVRTGKVQREWK